MRYLGYFTVLPINELACGSCEYYLSIYTERKSKTRFQKSEYVHSAVK